MGWLFAVALGLQERSRRAVFSALIPIALGHALAIGLIIILWWLAQTSLPAYLLKYMAAAILFSFGLFRLVRSRHPAWVGMQVGFRDLLIWSFVMASAHGAGLMLLPVFLGWPATSPSSHAAHTDQLALEPGPLADAVPTPWLPAAIVVHTLGHLLIAALLAFVIYEKAGLAILRRAWINLDLIWVLALILSGVIVLIL